jgi:hypothetical protein
MPTQSEISLSPISAKGDLISTDGFSRTRVPVGSNNHIITARSSTTSGVQFEAPLTSGEAGLVFIGSTTATANIANITLSFSLSSRTSVVALYVTGIVRTTRSSANETAIHPNGTSTSTNAVSISTVNAGSGAGSIMQIDPVYADSNRYTADNYTPFYFYYAGPYSHSAGVMNHMSIGQHARINDGVTTLGSTSDRIYFTSQNNNTAISSLQMISGNVGPLLTAGSILRVYGITKE